MCFLGSIGRSTVLNMSHCFIEFIVAAMPINLVAYLKPRLLITLFIQQAHFPFLQDQATFCYYYHCRISIITLIILFFIDFFANDIDYFRCHCVHCVSKRQRIYQIWRSYCEHLCIAQDMTAATWIANPNLTRDQFRTMVTGETHRSVPSQSCYVCFKDHHCPISNHHCPDRQTLFAYQISQLISMLNNNFAITNHHFPMKNHRSPFKCPVFPQFY